MKNLPTCFYILFMSFSIYGFGQKQLRVNGEPVNTNACATIKVLSPVPNGQVGIRCDIRDAQIIDDCIELTVVYGGCNGNLELYTDNKISDSDSKLNLKLVWQEPSFCKSMILVKVTFDLKPYKALVKEKTAMIKILDTDFELYYN